MDHVTRFAPSPTGALHLGHVAAARFARERGHRFLLRMEDIDAARCRPAHAAGIEADLRWLGLTWDGPVRTQSAHLPEYAAALARLRTARLLYPCFCTRADIAAASAAPHGTEGARYPGTCRALSDGERADRIGTGQPHAWRLDMAAALHRTGPLTWFEQATGPRPCDPAAFGDAVLGRKDAPASYHLCVTHDDALQGITLVTRGTDLLAATSVHRTLQTLLDWPEPTYAHHALLLGPDGKRLAKRDGATTVAAMRMAGMTAAEVLTRAAVLAC